MLHLRNKTLYDKKKCVGLLKVLYNYVVKLHTKVTLLLKYKLKENGQIYNSAM